MVRAKLPMSTTVAPDSPASPSAARRGRAGRIVAVLVIAGVFAAAFALVLRTRKQAATSGPPGPGGASRVVSVLTAKAARQNVPVWLEGLGTVAAFYRVTVKPQVDGRLDKVFFSEGQAVKQGDLLAQIDPRPFAIRLEGAQAALARDKANLKNAEVNVQRYEALAKDNLVTGQQLSDQQATAAQLEAQLRVDQAQIDDARLNLDYARIRSPIDGVTGVRLVDPGNVVRATDPTGLVVVTQIDPIAVLFTLPEQELPEVREAMLTGKLAVEAFSRDGERKLGEGELSVIDNEIDSSTATARLKAIFPNPERRLWPNQFVKARLRLTTREGALVVPTAAVQHGPEGTFVYVVGADSTANLRPLRVVTTVGDQAIVGQGVAPGDEVVVSGQAQLRPGARVSSKAASRGP